MRALAVAAAAFLAACGASPSGPEPSSRLLADRFVQVRGQSLAVHIAAGSGPSNGPLLLYATGDGGWPGQERLFDRMMPWGYPMAGFSSADYIASVSSSSADNPGRALDPETVATDLGAIVNMAQSALGLPSELPVVIVGFSRGAGLAVGAATSDRFRARLRGLLAIALTAEEQYVTEHAPGPAAGAARELQTYGALPRLGPLRVALIQSTGDEFVPAADAERLFGPSGPMRRFRSITAKDHSFGGSLAALTNEMKAAVEWIVK